MTTNKEKLITRMQHTPSELKVREAAEGERESRTITGYAILFGVPSAPLGFYDADDEEVREVISPSAVTPELLDSSDIKMTMFHDRQLILARSKNGSGTLTYTVDEKGVAFEFEAPRTADGDKALELVRRGDIAGCSFMFTTHYYDDTYVSREVQIVNGKTLHTYTVNTITGIHDFTLAADPAYPDTHCEAEARELVRTLRESVTSPEQEEPQPPSREQQEQLREMRIEASRPLLI